MKPSLLILSALLASLPLVAQAQGVSNQQPTTIANGFTQPFSSAGASADYRVGPGDVLGILVYRSPDMNSQITVDTDGTIVFPELGRVNVQDLTMGQIAESLESRFRHAGILVNPVVNVTVTQLRSKRVSVMGAVGHPGDVPLDRQGLLLSQVLAVAGANFGTGDAAVTVMGGAGSDATPEHFRIADIVSGRNDRPARSGEVIVVESAPLVYVTGEVGHPGAFPLEPNMTVDQSIAVAGGVTTRGSIHRLRITRKQKDGSTQNISHPRLQTVLEPDDVVFVKTRVF
jgi:polysaccharide export outer membrane protein